MTEQRPLDMQFSSGSFETVQRVSDFDELKIPANPRVKIRRANRFDVNKLIALAQDNLSDPIAPAHIVEGVIGRNPNNLLAIDRGEDLAGAWAMLMLNARGLEALLTGTLDPHDPDLRLLAASTEAPAAIYVWVIMCPGVAAEGIHHVAHFLRQPLYAAANLYSRPTTPPGIKINLRRGFSPLRDCPYGFYQYIRRANRSRKHAPALRQAATVGACDVR